ncbi:hypothetical protein H257_10929 [Aphanomyces astaci]|nr:hypothetical protein H257_10929 [Aphanomyces astaci]ETV74337.1 hypothetical protein H257_10929 [Aphanomyces astaci]|eukprot:XP_009835995.1 hypothetical protein H257_10929 [Aphanomyces astaci]
MALMLAAQRVPQRLLPLHRVARLRDAVRRMHVEPSQNAVEELIQTSPVVFFSKSYCPFCVRVKELFEDMDIKPLTIELDDLEAGQDIQDVLADMTSLRTVPNVFINGRHIGGCDSVMKLAKSNTLLDTINHHA